MDNVVAKDHLLCKAVEDKDSSLIKRFIGIFQLMLCVGEKKRHSPRETRDAGQGGETPARAERRETKKGEVSDVFVSSVSSGLTSHVSSLMSNTLSWRLFVLSLRDWARLPKAFQYQSPRHSPTLRPKPDYFLETICKSPATAYIIMCFCMSLPRVTSTHPSGVHNH